MTIQGTFKYDNLFAGSAEVVTDSVTLGADLSRGTVLGIISASGLAVAVDSQATDGSQNPYAILADDASTGEVAPVYLTGEFNEDALVFGGTDTTETHKRALRDIGIFLKKNINA